MTSPIRVATPEDAARIRQIYTPMVTGSHTSFEVRVPTERQIRGRLERGLRRYPWLVYDADEPVVGYAYAGAFRSRAAYKWAAETSLYVEERHRGSGFGGALYEALFEILVRQRFTQAVAGIALPNPGSVGFHEAMGFRKVAHFPAVGFKEGAWRDVGWWRRPLAAAETPPRPPVWFADL